MATIHKVDSVLRSCVGKMRVVERAGGARDWSGRTSYYKWVGSKGGGGGEPNA